MNNTTPLAPTIEEDNEGGSRGRAEKASSAEGSIHRILVPIAFDEASERALVVAKNIGKRFNAELLLVHVSPLPSYPPYPYADDSDGSIREAISAAKSMLADVLAETQRTYARAESLTMIGNPWGEIVEAAREHGVDLIVMGSHGHRGVSRFFHRKVAENVVRHATVPVLTVPAESPADCAAAIVAPIGAIPLPKPRLDATVGLAEALRQRRTERAISARPLDLGLISNVLFAAAGVNRTHGPFGDIGITAASASNCQEIDIYVTLTEGAFRFDARQHALLRVSDADVRHLALGPHQPSICPDAPMHLVYAVDLDRLEHTRGFEEPGLHDPEVQRSYYFVDTGLIAGNVYLFAAGEGLACWFHNCDRAGLEEVLALGPTQHVLFAQTIGYPATKT